MPRKPSIRSFNRVNTRGRPPMDGPESGNGYNSLGQRPIGGRGPGLQNDASNGMVRSKSQTGSTMPGSGSKKAPPRPMR